MRALSAVLILLSTFRNTSNALEFYFFLSTCAVPVTHQCFTVYFVVYLFTILCATVTERLPTRERSDVRSVQLQYVYYFPNLD